MRFAVPALLMLALAAGGPAPALAQVGGQPVLSRAYTVEPFVPDSPITIQGQGVRLRAEPFASRETPVLSSGSTGLQLTVVGIARQPDWNWYQVVLRNGQKAFIRSDLTSAPSRGGSAQQPVTAPAQPPLATYTPPQAPIPYTPAQPSQPLTPIPTQPLGTGGAISLTPGAPQPGLPPAASAPVVDNGLISVAPSAPTPRFSSPASSNIAGLIRTQLDDKRCWTDSSNMMDAQRLRATFAVSFDRNGRFNAEPRLVQPAAEPAGDPSMMVFIAKARAALRTCNALGFDVPADYFSAGAGEVQLDFSAR